MKEKDRLYEFIKRMLMPAIVGVLAYLGSELAFEEINKYLSITILLAGLLSDVGTTIKGIESGQFTELNPIFSNKPSKSEFMNKAIIMDSIWIAIAANIPGFGIGIGVSKFVTAGLNILELNKIDGEK